MFQYKVSVGKSLTLEDNSLGVKTPVKCAIRDFYGLFIAYFSSVVIGDVN